jgi:hypothetical protein
MTPALEIIISADAYTKSILSIKEMNSNRIHFYNPQNITSRIAILPEHLGLNISNSFFQLTDLLFTPPRTNSVFLVASKLKYSIAAALYFQCQLNPDAPDSPLKSFFFWKNRSKFSYATLHLLFT